MNRRAVPQISSHLITCRVECSCLNIVNARTTSSQSFSDNYPKDKLHLGKGPMTSCGRLYRPKAPNRSSDAFIKEMFGGNRFCRRGGQKRPDFLDLITRFRDLATAFSAAVFVAGKSFFQLLFSLPRMCRRTSIGVARVRS